jgi:hypothetical protein
MAQEFTTLQEQIIELRAEVERLTQRESEGRGYVETYRDFSLNYADKIEDQYPALARAYRRQASRMTQWLDGIEASSSEGGGVMTRRDP